MPDRSSVLLFDVEMSPNAALQPIGAANDVWRLDLMFSMLCCPLQSDWLPFRGGGFVYVWRPSSAPVQTPCTTKHYIKARSLGYPEARSCIRHVLGPLLALVSRFVDVRFGPPSKRRSMRFLAPHPPRLFHVLPTRGITPNDRASCNRLSVCGSWLRQALLASQERRSAQRHVFAHGSNAS
jgi:hypothetical protein